MDYVPGGEKASGVFAIIAISILALVQAAFKVDNADLFWHLKTGEWIVNNLAIPRADFFSFTREGAEWIDAQWLFQVILYLSYRGLGLPFGTIVQMALTVGVLFLLIFSAPSQEVPLPLRAAAGFGFILAINPRIICRPEMLSCLYLAALCFALERALRGRRVFLLLAPLIQLFFANSQGLWPMGIGLCGAYTLDALWKMRAETGQRRRRAGAWLAMLIAVAAVNAAQPYGVRGLLFPYTLLREVTLDSSLHKSFISEFHPLYSNTNWLLSFIPFMAFGVLSLVSALITGRRMRPALFLLGLVFYFLAINAVRNVSVSSVVLAIVLIAHLPALTDKVPEGKARELVLRWSSLLVILGVVFFSFLSLGTPRRYWDRTRNQRGFGINVACPYYPIESAEFLKSINYRGNLINSISMGGYLIWVGWPGWKVFADPRFEIGGERAIAYYKGTYAHIEHLNAVARRNQASAVVISYRRPYDMAFLRILKDEQWALVHLDHTAAVFLRRGAGFDELIAEREIENPFGVDILWPDEEGLNSLLRRVRVPDKMR